MRSALLLAGVVSCLVAQGASVYVYLHPGHVAVFDPEGRQTTVPCSCDQGGCSCCAPLIPHIINQQGCLNTFYAASSNATAAINFKIDNTLIFKQTLAGIDAPQLCFPVPMLPVVTVCVRLYNIMFVDGGIYTCIKMEFNAFTITLLVLNFDCFQISTSGVISSKPKT